MAFHAVVAVVCLWNKRASNCTASRVTSSPRGLEAAWHSIEGAPILKCGASKNAGVWFRLCADVLIR